MTEESTDVHPCTIEIFRDANQCIKCWWDRWIGVQTFARILQIFCMMYVDSIEYLEVGQYGVWTYDGIFGDGRYACVKTMLNVSEGLKIWIQPLGMSMAWSVRMFAKFKEIFRFFGLTGAEQVHAYHRLVPSNWADCQSFPEAFMAPMNWFLIDSESWLSGTSVCSIAWI